MVRTGLLAGGASPLRNRLTPKIPVTGKSTQYKEGFASLARAQHEVSHLPVSVGFFIAAAITPAARVLHRKKDFNDSPLKT